MYTIWTMIEAGRWKPKDYSDEMEMLSYLTDATDGIGRRITKELWLRTEDAP